MNTRRLIFLAGISTFLLVSCVEDDMTDLNTNFNTEQKGSEAKTTNNEIGEIKLDSIEIQNQVENNLDTDAENEPCRPWICNKVE